MAVELDSLVCRVVLSGCPEVRYLFDTYRRVYLYLPVEFIFCDYALYGYEIALVYLGTEFFIKLLIKEKLYFNGVGKIRQFKLHHILACLFKKSCIDRDDPASDYGLTYLVPDLSQFYTVAVKVTAKKYVGVVAPDHLVLLLAFFMAEILSALNTFVI